MKKAMAAVVALIALMSRAALDVIDADGVTEKGGSSSYARMLPRTGANGMLDASLLPPVADWASQPISGLYYVSAGADHEGNGSPQYPFKTLTAAMTNALAGSAIVVAPSTYSGAGTIAAGKTLTICGFGKSTYLSTLRVSAVGSTYGTELRLCGLSVGTLVVDGGYINVRLSDATVSVLSGSAGGIYVTRMDCGSKVEASTRAAPAYTDYFVGYDTANKALTLVNADNSMSMSLAGGRAVIGEDKVAYVTDVSAATGSVFAVTAALSNGIATVSSGLAAETAARAAADAAVTNSIDAKLTVLDNKIYTTSTNWNTRLNAVAASVSTVDSRVTEVYAKETNDIHAVEVETLSIRADFAAADDELDTELREEIGSEIASVRTDIPGIADDRADAKIAAARSGIISDAVSESKAYVDPKITNINASVSSLNSKVSAISRTNATHSADIANLQAKDTQLQKSINAVTTNLYSSVSTLNDAISDVRVDYAEADAAVLSQAEAMDSALLVSIPYIAQTNAERVLKINKDEIIDEAVDRSTVIASNYWHVNYTRMNYYDKRIANIETNMQVQITRINSRLSDLTTRCVNLSNRVEYCYKATTDRLDDLEEWRDEIEEWKATINGYNLKSKINAIIDALTKIKNGGTLTDADIPSKIE